MGKADSGFTAGARQPNLVKVRGNYTKNMLAHNQETRFAKQPHNWPSIPQNHSLSNPSDTQKVTWFFAGNSELFIRY